MRDILEGQARVLCLFDDVIIHGHSQEEYNEYLVNTTLKNIKNAGVALKKEKCQFSSNNVRFLVM